MEKYKRARSPKRTYFFKFVKKSIFNYNKTIIQYKLIIIWLLKIQLNERFRFSFVTKFSFQQKV